MNKRESLVVSAQLIGVIVILSTYFLSLVSQLNAHSVKLIWLILTTVLLLFSFYLQLWGKVSGFSFTTQKRDFVDILSIIIGIIFFSVLLLLAFSVVPNNYDGLSYHLPRILHWLQNSTAAHYVTSNDRQLWMSPLSEYIGLHFYALGSSIKLVALIQLLSLIFSLVVLSLMVRRLKGNKEAQILTLAFAISSPMVILQATSVQTDLVAAFFSLASIYWIWKFLDDDIENENATIILVTLSPVMAFLAKATSLIYIAPFSLILFWHLLKSKSYRILFKMLRVGTVCYVVLCSYFFYQNLLYYNNVLGPDNSRKMQLNEKIGPSVFIIQAAKGIGTQLSTPVPLGNSLVYSLVEQVHKGLGYSLQDERFLFIGIPYEQVRLQMFGHEDEAPNPVHTVIITFTLIAVFLTNSKNKKEYALLLLISFFLFSGVLRWQPWISRLHTFYFLAFSPIIGTYLADLLSKRKAHYVALLFIALSIPWVVFNTQKPLILARAIWFNSSWTVLSYSFSNRADQYLKMFDAIPKNNCNNISLRIGGDDPEYVWWYLLEPLDNNITLLHLQTEDREVCAIIDTIEDTPQIIRPSDNLK